ncbi:MAG: hypothetical protein L3K14_08155 [Thermoplasmata archaeon]|nr:hypothetical protein [Thermoplasmata archaeon]
MILGVFLAIGGFLVSTTFCLRNEVCPSPGPYVILAWPLSAIGYIFMITGVVLLWMTEVATPVEWVDGDLVRAREFTIVDLVSTAIGILIPGILVWASYAGRLGAPASPLGLAGLALLVAPLGAFLAGVAVSRIARSWPVVKRLGISPVEVRLEYSFRNLRTPWNRVRWGDPVRLEVLQWGGSAQFLLTDSQANRIRRFFQYGQPLASSATGSERTLVRQ